MKKIIIVMLSAVVVSCSMLYACGGHCDFDNPKYAEETKIFDDAMYLYNEINDENITIEECLSIARSMNEMEKAKAETNMKEMDIEK
jgi:hypothetical protein